jgi:hypothetical protein
MPEIRRLIARFQLTIGRSLDHILQWSLWRRIHQAVAKAYHYQRTAAKYINLLKTQL